MCLLPSLAEEASFQLYFLVFKVQANSPSFEMIMFFHNLEVIPVNFFGIYNFVG